MDLLALVLAGGEGTRLHPLTQQHAKPALPFAEGRRIVDFVLSNLVNSAIGRICVLAQYKPESLVEHIESAWRSRFAAQGVSIEVQVFPSHSQVFVSECPPSPKPPTMMVLPLTGS